MTRPQTLRLLLVYIRTILEPQPQYNHNFSTQKAYNVLLSELIDKEALCVPALGFST